MQKQQKKMEELFDQLSLMDRERSRILDTVARFEEENKTMATELEEVKIENMQLKKHIELMEERVSQQQVMREERLSVHQSTIKNLEQQLEERAFKLKEVVREKEAMETRYQDELTTVREEMEMAREKVMLMKKNEAIIEVYKKKIEGMVQMS